MRFLRRSLTGLFLLAVTLAALTFAVYEVKTAVDARAARDSRAGMGRERVYSANVVPVEAQTISPILSAFGELRARRTLEVRSSTAGTVVALGPQYEEGGRVEVGEVLIRLDTRDLEDALALAQTDVADAEAETRDAVAALELTQDDLASTRRQVELYAQALARQEDLQDRGVGSPANVESAALSLASAEQSVLSRRSALANAETRVNTAANALARARISLAEAERALDDSTVRAAFAGTLGDVTAVEGGILTANEMIATLVDPTSLEVSFRLSTAQHARLLNEAGALTDTPVTIRLAVSGVELTATGRVERESALVGDGLTGRLIFARLDAVPGFRPGDFVTVEVEEPALTGAALLPASALDAANTVLVLGPEDRLEQHVVEVLRRQGDTVLIRAGEIDGREVVEERSPVLGAGILIRPLRPGGEAGGPGAGAGTGLPGGAMIALDEERRARLIAFVEGNTAMSADARDRILIQLREVEVPEDLVTRLESRMGS